MSMLTPRAAPPGLSLTEREALAAALGELPGLAAALRRLADGLTDEAAVKSIYFAVAHIVTAQRRVEHLVEVRR